MVNGTKEDLRALNSDDISVVWAIMGFYPKKVVTDFLIHDYRSLSTGKLAKIKDFAKRIFNQKPNLRIFLNEYQRETMNFTDQIPSCILPMGIPDWLFEREFQECTEPKSADLIYIGEITRERGMDEVLESYKNNISGTNFKFMLIGQPEQEIKDRYKDTPGVIFTGKLPQDQTLKLVARARATLSFCPYHYPYTHQTPTKLLEYAALGKPIICNDSPSNLEWCDKLGIRAHITGPDVFQTLTQEEILEIPENPQGALKHLSWNSLILHSGVAQHLPLAS